MFHRAAESWPARMRRRSGAQERWLFAQADKAAAQKFQARAQKGAVDIEARGRIDLRNNDRYVAHRERTAGAMVMRDPHSRSGQAGRSGNYTYAGKNLDRGQVSRECDRNSGTRAEQS